MTENVIGSEHERLLAFIRFRINSPEDSEDLLQDVYVQALEHLNAMNAIDNVTGWLFQIARNKIIDWYRRNKIPRVSLDCDDETGRSLHDLLHIGESSDYDEEAYAFITQALQAGIETLPEEQRLVIIQQVLEGRTFREIASETGVPINTLIARKRYAIQSLRKTLAYVMDSYKD